jgi:LEA14-like dessication related protein
VNLALARRVWDRGGVNARTFFAAARLSLGVLAPLVLAACSPPDPPTLVPKSAAVKSVGLTGLQLDVQIDATNPNSSDLTAQKVAGKVGLNGMALGTFELPQNVVLPAGKTTTITATVTSPWQNVQMLVPLAAAGKPIPYSVDGTVTVGGSRLNVDLPFHLDGVITAQQMHDAVASSLPKGIQLPF